MKQTDPGSGPPFSVKVEVMLRCPGIKSSRMCGSSPKQIDKLRALMEEGELDRDPLWFCATYNCPLFKPRGEGPKRTVTYRITSIESLHLTTKENDT